MVKAGLSLMIEDDFRRAVIPLFEEGVVDAVEWSFDTAWPSGPPAWMEALLSHYGDAGCLYGHGVSFSLLSARFEPRQEEWLRLLHEERRHRPYRHISEHYGFMTAGAFVRGAPLPVPITEKTLALGRERLLRFADAAGTSVGLENLAFAFSALDVDGQGPFLRQLLEAVDGFLLLDLHNLYCQARNFGRDLGALLATYPLERVREIHVSGGSWSHGGFRRDTHDHDVPSEVWDILPEALAGCPRVEVCVLERLGGTLTDPGAAARLREDFLTLRSIARDR